MKQHELRLFMHKHKLSQKELAEKLDVSTSTISNWVCGRTKIQNEDFIRYLLEKIEAEL